MNSYTKIALILLLSSLTTLIRTGESNKELGQIHEDNAKIACQVADRSFTWLVTNTCFEFLYKDLDKNGHVPKNWQFWRRINKPLIGVAGTVFVAASSTWFYHASLEAHYKEESKKWFWQK